jgi:hypothetical protein
MIFLLLLNGSSYEPKLERTHYGGPVAVPWQNKWRNQTLWGFLPSV